MRPVIRVSDPKIERQLSYHVMGYINQVGFKMASDAGLKVLRSYIEMELPGRFFTNSQLQDAWVETVLRYKV
jgi:hypothetical protein